MSILEGKNTSPCTHKTIIMGGSSRSTGAQPACLHEGRSCHLLLTLEEEMLLGRLREKLAKGEVKIMWLGAG